MTISRPMSVHAVTGGWRSSEGRGRGRSRPGSIALALCLALVLAAPASAYPRPGRTALVAVSSAGETGDDLTSWDSLGLSADGRYVAFSSGASNLVPGDTNECWDVFVRDRLLGTTERVNLTHDGQESNCGDPFFPFGLSRSGATRPVITPNGRFVAFESTASNLVEGDTNGCNGCADVFVRDRLLGTTERVSVASDGTEPGQTQLTPLIVTNPWSGWPSISADGRYVAFEASSALVPDDQNGFNDVYVHDRETKETERVSLASDGSERPTGGVQPTISADGRFVAFGGSLGAEAHRSPNGATGQAWVHDRLAGTTELVSVADDGTVANRHIFSPRISGNGRFVVFYSTASNLVPTDTNGRPDFFVRDLLKGTMERISVRSTGEEGTNSSTSTSRTSISPDGRYVAFTSGGILSSSVDSPSSAYIWVHDRVTRQTELASFGPGGGPQSAGWATGPTISADASTVGFDLSARDRGPTLGVGELEVVPGSQSVSVSGWARFTPQPETVKDLANDAGLEAREAGAEILEAGLIPRPEEDDVLLRVRVAELPHVKKPAEFCCEAAPPSVGGGLPALVYGASLTADGVRYELRASQLAGPEDPVTAAVGLFRCDPACERVSDLEGAIGTTGAEILISVPQAVLAGPIEDARAFAGIGRVEAGVVELLDEVVLGVVTVPSPEVVLGVAPQGTPESQVEFIHPASLAEGRFSGTVPLEGLTTGDYEVWARACLGERCGYASREL